MDRVLLCAVFAFSEDVDCDREIVLGAWKYVERWLVNGDGGPESVTDEASVMVSGEVFPLSESCIERCEEAADEVEAARELEVDDDGM